MPGGVIWVCRALLQVCCASAEHERQGAGQAEHAVLRQLQPAGQMGAAVNRHTGSVELGRPCCVKTSRAEQSTVQRPKLIHQIHECATEVQSRAGGWIRRASPPAQGSAAAW